MNWTTGFAVFVAICLILILLFVADVIQRGA